MPKPENPEEPASCEGKVNEKIKSPPRELIKRSCRKFP